MVRTSNIRLSNLEVARRSPHLEAFRERGTEVVLFADPVDEVWLQRSPPEFQGKRWRSVGEGEGWPL